MIIEFYSSLLIEIVVALLYNSWGSAWIIIYHVLTSVKSNLDKDIHNHRHILWFDHYEHAILSPHIPLIANGCS